MATIEALNGKYYNTAEVNPNLDLGYCSNCGDRICWYEHNSIEAPVLICEDCIARMQEE